MAPDRMDDDRPRAGDDDPGEFYERWSAKSRPLIDHDVVISQRKADRFLTNARPALEGVRRVLDFGCGYGAALQRFADGLGADRALGVDFSAAAIEVARERFATDTVAYEVVETLDPEEAGEILARLLPDGADCVLLIDVLEHVPDCRALMAVLARFSGRFAIKLPLEDSVFDNYARRKEYPGPGHSNGHLREFTANNVHYFIRELGLTPAFEALYVYPLDEFFPPPPEPLGPVKQVKRGLHMAFRKFWAVVLPRRTYLRLIGGGGYYCVATYDAANVLNP